MKVLITGGAGFIGSALIRHILRSSDWEVVNLDKLTYASNPAALEAALSMPRYCFEKGDICDLGLVRHVFKKHRPNGVIHLAAETHVDRSIDDPSTFIDTNIVGVHVLLETALSYWRGLQAREREVFRFHHVSTDEVYGELGFDDPPFDETTRYAPSSPYSASKAASDHLVRAWNHTYGFPTVVSNCSNNYGPWQFPEKLIPLLIVKALQQQTLPIYGDGQNVRDWLFVEDHAEALWRVFRSGQVGDTYNIGGRCQQTNSEVAEEICRCLDEIAPLRGGAMYRDSIRFVPDRPGHDFRYAMDIAKIERDLRWIPRWKFQDGIMETVRWYADHAEWWKDVESTRYSGFRLGRVG